MKKLLRNWKALFTVCLIFWLVAGCTKEENKQTSSIIHGELIEDRYTNRNGKFTNMSTGANYCKLNGKTVPCSGDGWADPCPGGKIEVLYPSDPNEHGVGVSVCEYEDHIVILEDGTYIVEVNN